MALKSNKLTALALVKQATEPVGSSFIEARLGDVPQRTLRRWLKSWTDEGIIEKIGKGRATRYFYTSHQSDYTNKLTFLDGLDNDLRVSLLNQLRDLWTYNSTAIEGNTLTLGDTHFVLEQGLTISGKPLKDHQEVIGHAKAIELLYQSLDEPLTESFIFELHQSVLTEIVSDIYKPIGSWKIETNGTYAISDDKKQTFIEYALPSQVPLLMFQLIEYINSIDIENISISNAHQYYAKIHMALAHIHPFWDGNGRIARLVANIPLLKAGLPPLVVPLEERRVYIQTLANYQIRVGQLNVSTTIWPKANYLKDFEIFCNSIYSTTKTLIENAIEIQKKRNHIDAI